MQFAWCNVLLSEDDEGLWRMFSVIRSVWYRFKTALQDNRYRFSAKQKRERSHYARLESRPSFVDCLVCCEKMRHSFSLSSLACITLPSPWALSDLLKDFSVLKCLIMPTLNTLCVVLMNPCKREICVCERTSFS